MPDARLRALILALGALLAILLATWPARWAHAAPFPPPTPSVRVPAPPVRLPSPQTRLPAPPARLPSPAPGPPPHAAGPPGPRPPAAGPPGLPLPAAASPAPAPPGTGWRPPLTGRLTVTRPFVPPLTRFGRGHRGVDLAALPGTPVRSAGTGTVRFAAPLAGRGVVVVATGEIRTTYEPVRAAVRAGQPVRAGETIGFLDPGHLGCPAAACLHWGALRGQVYLDPLTLLRAERPRLLPYLGDTPAGARSPPGSTRQAAPASGQARASETAIGLGAGTALGAGLGVLIGRRRTQ